MSKGCFPLQAQVKDRLYRVQVHGKYGYMNDQGKIIIPPAYNAARKFRDGLAPVQAGDKWGYVDTTGNLVIRPQFEDARIFAFGLASVQTGGHWGYINRQGKIVIPATGKTSHPNCPNPKIIANTLCDTPINPGSIHYINTSCFAFPSPTTSLGTARRNSLIGPGLQNLDFGIFKNNPIPRISESVNAQFRVEFFNLLNHTNLAPPSNNPDLCSGRRCAVGKCRPDHTTNGHSVAAAPVRVDADVVGGDLVNEVAS